MLNLNPTTLAAVAEQACRDAAQHDRWLVAIGRALIELDQNPWIERGELHGLIIGSPSGNLYSANGTCQCQAYTYGQPCWHRAAARLVRLHDEAIERDLATTAGQVARMVLEAEAIIDRDRVARKIAAARCAAQFNAELFA